MKKMPRKQLWTLYWSKGINQCQCLGRDSQHPPVPSWSLLESLGWGPWALFLDLTGLPTHWQLPIWISLGTHPGDSKWLAGGLSEAKGLKEGGDRFSLLGLDLSSQIPPGSPDHCRGFTHRTQTPHPKGSVTPGLTCLLSPGEGGGGVRNSRWGDRSAGGEGIITFPWRRITPRAGARTSFLAPGQLRTSLTLQKEAADHVFMHSSRTYCVPCTLLGAL